MRYTLGASDFVETGAVDCALSAFSFQLAFFFFFFLSLFLNCMQFVLWYLRVPLCVESKGFRPGVGWLSDLQSPIQKLKHRISPNQISCQDKSMAVSLEVEGIAMKLNQGEKTDKAEFETVFQWLYMWNKWILLRRPPDNFKHCL